MLPTDWQARHLKSVERIAGPRYDRVLDVDVDFASVFAGLGRTDQFRDALASVGNRLGAVFKYGLREGQPEQLDCVVKTAQSTAEALLNASACPADGKLDFARIVGDARSGMDAAWALRGTRRDSDREKANDGISEFVLHDANKAADLLNDAVELCEGRDSRAASEQILLLTGPAGAGKTHMLVHIANQRATKGLASIVLFGDRFSGFDQVQSFSARLGRDETYPLPQILDELEVAGAATGTRSFLLIDGINETSSCSIWQDGLKWLAEALLDHPHVCAVLSVRDGFQDAVATRGFLESALVVQHPGFARNLWQAVQQFFAYYQVQWPEVPLLGPEFANPLFLKLFCTAFAGETPRSFRGHAGGTHIFEAYAKKVGPAINVELEAPGAASNYCWTALIKPLATWMGENGVQEIPVEEALSIADTAYSGHGARALASMENHALIMKSPRFDRDGEVSRYVYRFSYQKFSDHLIVRFLLNHHFDPTAAEPGKAFAQDTRLGRIANLDEGRGLLEALAAQIPERTNGARELTNYVSDEIARSWLMSSAFLDSLVWRKSDALGQPAIDYINDVIFDDTRLLEELFEVLLCVASIPDFRLNARGLHKLLAGWTLADRDGIWTGWLRYQYMDEGTAVDRLVSWARTAPGRGEVVPEAALLTATALCWLLVSPDRFLRDDATKAAVALLEHHPRVVPELIRMFEAVDDPYVLERTLCAALGALTRNPDHEALVEASSVLLEGFFARRECTHVLTRDYARGIVELAVSSGVLNEGDVGPARPPYGSTFPEDVPSKEGLKALYADADGHVSDYGSIWHSVMEWDFGWYIIGTNSGSTPWSSRRLGEPRPPTLKERWGQFQATLSEDASRAFLAWEESKTIDSMRLLTAQVRNGGESQTRATEREEPVRESELRALLTAEQVTEFDGLRSSSEEHVRDDTFDLRIEQSWVFLRCLELGWTKERFGTADSQQGRNRGDTRKTERIGKKYQWIAHYEFLGLLADNYALRPPWGSSESPVYKGPWLDFLRDIDPTCLLDGLARADGPTWCATPSYDPDALKVDDEPWLAVLDDLVDPAQIIELVDDEGAAWVALEGFYEWRPPVAPGIEPHSVLHRHVWYQVQCYLVPVDQAHVFMEWAYTQNFMGRWMPENRGFSEVYLREYPAAQAFRDLLIESEPERTGWVQEIRGATLEVPLLVASDSYSASSADRDCSIKESFTVGLPAHSLVEEMGLAPGPVDGSWLVGGQLVALDPSVGSDASTYVLIRRSSLQEHLARAGLTAVWTVMAAKELSGGWQDREGRLPGADVNGAYWLQPEGVVGRLWMAGDAADKA
ncbi:MAG: ATP-binding protein [Actinomycetota bacterium]|nr:ATP-binding protein [Actinomycetota bacterium]